MSGRSRKPKREFTPDTPEDEQAKRLSLMRPSPGRESDGDDAAEHVPEEEALPPPAHLTSCDDRSSARPDCELAEQPRGGDGGDGDGVAAEVSGRPCGCSARGRHKNTCTAPKKGVAASSGAQRGTQRKNPPPSSAPEGEARRGKRARAVGEGGKVEG